MFELGIVGETGLCLSFVDIAAPFLLWDPKQNAIAFCNERSEDFYFCNTRPLKNNNGIFSDIDFLHRVEDENIITGFFLRSRSCVPCLMSRVLSSNKDPTLRNILQGLIFMEGRAIIDKSLEKRVFVTSLDSHLISSMENNWPMDLPVYIVPPNNYFPRILTRELFVQNGGHILH